MDSHFSSDRRLTYVIVLLISKMSEKRKSTSYITTFFKKTTKVYQGKYQLLSNILVKTKNNYGNLYKV